MPDAPDPRYALFDLPRPLAGAWSLARELDDRLVCDGVLFSSPELLAAWNKFFTLLGGEAMRRAYPVLTPPPPAGMPAAPKGGG